MMPLPALPAARMTTRPDAPGPLPDILASGLAVVFCGINPGLLAAGAGHHFLGRGNRFWRVLHLAGFTPREIRPEEDRTILAYRCGLTSVAGRPTAAAHELSSAEFAAVADAFRQKITGHAPAFVAFLGKAAWSALCGERDIVWGAQPAGFCGAKVWVLPNPSGRNRAFSLERLVAAYRPLYRAAGLAPPHGQTS